MTPPFLNNNVYIFSSIDCNLDLLFIVDASGSIKDANPSDKSYDNWELLLTFLKTVVRQFPIGQQGTIVSIVVFSTQAQLVFPFTEATSEAEVLRLIDTIPYLGGWTSTADGLKIGHEGKENFKPKERYR